MNLTENALKTLEELLPGHKTSLKVTDPEFLEIVTNFAFDEVIGYSKLDAKIRTMMILGSMIATQSLNEYKTMLEAALNAGVTPINIKEVLYQAVPYVGMAKAPDFISATNEVFEGHDIELPLPNQSTTTRETRREQGLAVQKSIFGDVIDSMYEKSPKDQLHFQGMLSANCFGDYYTRKGLDLKTRELLTYAILISFGGVDTQVKAHIQGNLNLGADKQLLIDLTTQLLPYIGYPRTLNAIKAINEVIPD